MSKHTPGPWKVREKWYITSANDPYVGTFAEVKCCMGVPVDALETHEANARLIAASPALLAACKEMIEAEAFARQEDQASCKRLYEAWRTMRLTVALAEGQS